MSINENTIASTTDTKVTLLQWLKTLDKNITELQENGVPANTPVYSAKEFDEKYNNANGEYVNCILVLDGTYTETIYLNGQLYGGDNVPVWAASGYHYFIFGTYADYVYFKEDGFGECSFHNGYLWSFNDTFTELLEEDEFNNGGKLFTQTDVDNSIDDKISTDVYAYTNWGGLYNGLLSRQNLHQLVYQQKKTCYGLCGANSTGVDMAIGMFKYNANIFVYNFNGILVKNNGEIYYSTGEGTLDSTSGEIENAISGSELKEAVRLATQKTYWHSVKIKGASGFFTFNAPSVQNTPVDSVQDLTTLFGGDTWAGSGKYGNDMLFEIDLHRDQPDFTKADDSSIGLASFGSLTISDDVKVVAE